MKLGLEVAAAGAAELLGKLAGGLSVVYTTLAIGYALFGRLELFAATAVSALALAALAVWCRKRPPGDRAIRALYLGAGLLIIANVSVEYGLSGDPIHGAAYMFTQLAVGFFVPYPKILAAFLVANIGAWIGTTLAFEVPPLIQDGVIGFVCTTSIGVLIFVSRVRRNGRMEELRRAVEAGRDRDLRAIIDKNPDAVILVRDHRVVYANAAAAATVALDSVADLVGRTLDSLIVDGRGEDLLRDGRAESAVVVVAGGDGGRVVLEFARPVALEFEHEPATMLVGRDVTRSREQLNAQLLLADRMSVAGTLAAGVAHEINNPLMYTAMNLSMLETAIAAGDSDEIAELLAEINDGVARVTNIVKELDAVSRITDERDGATDPIAALRSAVKVVSNRVHHGGELDLDLEPIPEVMINDGKLVQVFLNILINALDAIDDGDGSGGRISVTTGAEGRWAVIAIRDDGVGMSAETRSRIFDPFFTTKEPGRGTGLGMFFAHDVVTAAGGTIEVSSAPGEGTAVTIRLPVIADRRRTYARAQTPIEDIAETFSILVIDDEPLVGEAIKRVLSNYQVTVALEGADGIARFREHRHDLVLCDLMMPGMSGQAVYEKLREIDPTVDDRIVFVTGGAFTPAARKFADQMAGRIVKKPVEVADLLRLISEHAG